MASVIDILNAILSVLQDDSTLSAYVRQYEILPDLDEDTIKNVVKNFPALAIAAVGGDWEENATGQQDETGQFSILCCNKNLRSPSSVLLGEATGEKGLYQLVEDVRAAVSPLGVFTTEESSIFDNRAVRWLLIDGRRELAVAGVDIEVTWRHEL